MTKIFDEIEPITEEFKYFIGLVKSRYDVIIPYHNFLEKHFEECVANGEDEVRKFLFSASYVDYRDVNVDKKDVVKFLKMFFEKNHVLYEKYEKGYWCL